MATTTTTTHTCDLCHAERDEATLIEVWTGEPQDLDARGVVVIGMPRSAAICTACKARPISELLAVLNPVPREAADVSEAAQPPTMADSRFARPSQRPDPRPSESFGSPDPPGWRV
jgi:hypothetical protein